MASEVDLRSAGMSLPMDVVGIGKLIPHRYPFLLIDRVVDLVPGERVTALRAISVSDPILQGHFPGNPVVPGVLLIEASAQAAGVLGQVAAGGECSSFLLTEVSSARFRKVVVPGDTCRFDVVLQKQRGQFCWFASEVTVDGATVAEVEFSARLAR